MSTAPLRVLGISGSLRKGSFNTALLRAAIEIATNENLPLQFDVAEIRDIPLYDEDVRASGLPAAVQRFRDAISAADALLFVTPEYNYSVPGVLKNAIDWASRPPAQPFANKPVAIMGASGGMGGTMRAQYHLRQISVFLDMHIVNKPEVFVRNAQNIFDPHGKLTDEATRKVVLEQLRALIDWTRRIAHV
ncbi:MAG TPA: NADPH-dependent FMN reductase [Labilithrix sp.]|nr:NADPH-dependent FMN reductase [Labilithrix sp.]